MTHNSNVIRELMTGEREVSEGARARDTEKKVRGRKAKEKGERT